MDGYDKIIFAADNNENDKILFNKALEKTELPFKILYFKDGPELLKNLENYYSEKQAFPKMILLDLNIQKGELSIPHKPNGLETLKMLKSHFLYKTIPVLVISSERSDEDVVEAYNLGANSFIVKPATTKEFEDFITMLNSYWFELATI
jgi:two-component system response regulator